MTMVTESQLDIITTAVAFDINDRFFNSTCADEDNAAFVLGDDGHADQLINLTSEEKEKIFVAALRQLLRTYDK